MMEKKEIRGYTFLNQTSRDSYGTTEKTYLFKDEAKIAEGRDRWINRPWYRYRYQNSMMNAVHKLIDSRTKRLKDRFMAEKGYKKFTQKRSEEFKPVMDADELIQEYRALYKEL
jgi:hypothetical protein